MQTDKNNKERITIQIRVNQELKDGFTKYCETLGTTMSDELKRYMTICRNQYYTNTIPGHKRTDY